jgi:hypothetical protein
MTQTQKLIALVGLCVALVVTWPQSGPLAPAVDPSPFPADKLCVLIVEEQADRGSLPAKQIPIFDAAAVRKSIKDAGGDYRVHDKDDDVSLDAKWVQDAWKVERKELPTVIIGGPKGGSVQRLPNDVDEMLALLKKYGGA